MAKQREKRRGEGGVYPRGQWMWIRYYYPAGVRRREPVGKQQDCGAPVASDDKQAEKKAEAYLDAVRKKIGAAQLGHAAFVGASEQKVLVNEILTELIQKKEGDRLSDRPELYRVLRDNPEARILRPAFYSDVKRAAEWFGEMRAIDLTDKFWTNWKRQTAPVLLDTYEPSSINRALEIIRTALNVAKQQKKIADIPGSVSDVLFDESGNVREGFFEPDEYRRLLEAANEVAADMADFFTFGYLTGWRSGSVKALKWETVNMQTHVLVLPKKDEKTGHKNVMPLGNDGDDLWDLIKRRWTARRYMRPDGVEAVSEYIFHRSGEPIVDYRDAWDRACTKAELLILKRDGAGNPITTIIDGVETNVMQPSKLFHDFRRTAARDMIQAGVSKDVAKAITGHRTDHMFDRYNIIVNEQKVDAIRLRTAGLRESLGKISGKGKGK